MDLCSSAGNGSRRNRHASANADACEPRQIPRPSPDPASFSSVLLLPASVIRRCRDLTWLPLLLLLLLFLGLFSTPLGVAAMRPRQIAQLRSETVDLFYHGFDNYMRIAFPEDELRPISCTPLTRDAKNPKNVELNDVLGNYSLTLIDSLSTLAILASAPPDDRRTGPRALSDFQDGVAALVEQYGDGRDGPSGQGLRGRGFDVDSKVQVFETVIRGVGGLLSAHLFAVGALPMVGYDPLPVGGDPLDARPIVWPNGLAYDGQLLRLALDLATRLLPAFYTKTGMPYPRVNLRHGIPFYANSPLNEARSGVATPQGPAEITETCSAGAGSLVLEFTVLSRLTGDPRFEQLAKRAFWAVWYRKSQIGLIGAGVDAEQGHWIGAYSVIGAGADSFFEYALKTHILLSGHALPNRTAPVRRPDWMDPNDIFVPLSDAENSPDSFLEAWHHAHAAIKRHLYTDRDHPHYENVNLWTGSLASTWVDSLGAYYSGLLVLAGEVDEAVETNLLYAAIWTRYAALPERWSTRDKTVEGGLGWWPLRPEFIESVYHLYRATKDPWYLYVGEMVLRDITRRCWTPCGWAGLQNVLDGEKSDRMESFFLGETAKYMYLLFDDQHPLNKLDAAYVFTTEGHPLIIPRMKAAAGSPRPFSGSEAPAAAYADPSFTNTCPPPSSGVPLTGSATAARSDIYHAARMLDLHLLGDSDQASGRRRSPGSSPILYPWTLPPELVPDDGTCAKVNSPTEMQLEFASNAQQMVGGSAFSWTVGSQNLERLTADRIRVSSLSGLKITLRLEEAEEREWRVTKVNGVLLGRDEFVVMDRAILGELSDPRFNLVRDPVFAKLQHLHRVELVPEEADDEDDYDHEKVGDAQETAPASGVSEFGIRIKSLLNRIGSSLDFQALLTPVPYNLVINQTAIAPTGVGAAPLPVAVVPAGARTPEFGPVDAAIFPWTSVYAAGDACERRLPEEAARDHQVVVVRRGGCSFSAKLANLPAHAPSSRSLQLVVVVSDEEEDGAEYHAYALSAAGAGLVRPLLDEVQHTPGGMARRHPIPMIMVGGGEAAYHQLAAAERIGLARRYYIESQGSRVRNIMVDEGDAGVNS